MSSVAERHENARMIRESAAALADEVDYSRVRRLRFSDAGFDADNWATVAEMGWIGLPLPESRGGSGLGMVEYCALIHALGKGLTPEPLIEAVLAARLADDSLRGSILDGSVVASVAPAAKTEVRVAEGRASGTARFIPMAGGAAVFVVPVSGGWIFVRADARGATLEVEKTQDGGNVGRLFLDGVAVTVIEGDAGLANAEASLATASYLLGVMERAFEITLDYLKTRHQFGKPIGSFQALQHKATDLKLQLALTTASVQAAAETWDDNGFGPDAEEAISRAKTRASEAAMRITRECIQLHGAIGYTDEADISLFLRKAMTIANRYGSPAELRARRAAANIAMEGVSQ